MPRSSKNLLVGASGKKIYRTFQNIIPVKSITSISYLNWNNKKTDIFRS